MHVQGALAWIHWALGPVVPLFLGTPWDVMRDWLLTAMPVVHLRIGFRHVVLVGDAAGMKRIFQVLRAMGWIWAETGGLVGRCSAADLQVDLNPRLLVMCYCHSAFSSPHTVLPARVGF